MVVELEVVAGAGVVAARLEVAGLGIVELVAAVRRFLIQVVVVSIHLYSTLIKHAPLVASNHAMLLKFILVNMYIHCHGMCLVSIVADRILPKA